MRFHHLDLNRLVALDALLTLCSVSKAAASLHLSQPAMSGALASLRAFFGDPLLVPSGRAMVRTPFAETLVGPVRDVLLEVQAIACRRPATHVRDVRRHFLLAASDVSATVLLPELTRQAQQEAPGLSFEILPVTPDLAHDLERGDLDFIVGPDVIVSARHPRQRLFTAPYVCVAWQHSQIASRPFDLAAFNGAEHVAMRWWKDKPPIDEVALSKAGAVRKVAVALSSFCTFPQFIMHTERIATLPRPMAVALAGLFPLRILACPVEVPALDYCVQWQAHQDGDIAIDWVRRTLATIGRELPER